MSRFNSIHCGIKISPQKFLKLKTSSSSESKVFHLLPFMAQAAIFITLLKRMFMSSHVSAFRQEPGQEPLSHSSPSCQSPSASSVRPSSVPQLDVSERRDAGVTLMLPEVLNYPHVMAVPLSVPGEKQEPAAGFDQVGRLFHQAG